MRDVALPVAGSRVHEPLERRIHRDQKKLSQMVRQPVRDFLDVHPTIVKAVEHLECLLGIALRERLAEIEVGVEPREPQRLRHGGRRHTLRGERERLVQPPQRVPHASLRGPRDQRGRVLRERNLLLGGDVAQMRHQLLAPQASELENLAAGSDRVGHLERLGGAEDEPDVRRRLFERFQEGVPRKVRELVRLIDDVDLEFPSRGRVLHVLAEIPDLLDAAVRSSVDLEHVERRAAGDLDAAPALAAGLRLAGLAALAVQGLRDEPRRGRLPAPARAREEVGVRHTVLGDRLLQRGADGILADQVCKTLGAVLACEG